jgi:hypothetical protein
MELLFQRKMILIEARRLAIEMSITDFSGTISWCERFMRRNFLCMYTKTHRVKKTEKNILVAVTTIFWVSVMNKLYYNC